MTNDCTWREVGSMVQELPGGDWDACHICLEASPPPMQSGCACRGAAGRSGRPCGDETPKRAFNRILGARRSAAKPP